MMKQATPRERRRLSHTDHFSFFYRLIDTEFTPTAGFHATAPQSNGVELSWTPISGSVQCYITYTADLCQALVAERQLCSRLNGGNP
jgi:hypothetical protein